MGQPGQGEFLSSGPILDDVDLEQLMPFVSSLDRNLVLVIPYWT